jgi:hypothetical protein
MMSYTQNELSSIWQKAKDGNGIDAETCAYTCAYISIDGELEQTLAFPTVEPYSDFNNGGSPVYYTRHKHSKEAPWGKWVRKN